MEKSFTERWPRYLSLTALFQGGDAVWEGLRLYPEGIISLSKHIERLQQSAHALAFTDIPSSEEIRQAIRQTIEANNMDQDVHMRLTLTRGEKVTSGMDPRVESIRQSTHCLS